MLWTRVGGASPAGSVPVRWRVATDPQLRHPVASGVATARGDDDGTVHVPVEGLAPATTYWYAFEADGVGSPIGRTRTVPAGPAARLRIGFVCCSHWRTGFFNAYGRLADRDVDVVVHLGDYIYEDDPPKDRGPRRHDPSGRRLTLADYRARYAQYRTDPDLRRLHQRHPVVAVWDDHELAGNAWRDGARGHDPARNGPWPDRRDAAVRAYLEWLPVRRPDPADPLRLWRRVPFGPAMDLVVLDTRLYDRDAPVAGRRPVAGIRRRDRSLLGDAQRRWLADTLSGPDRGRWTLLVSQVVVAPVHLVPLPRWGAAPGRRLGAVGGGLVVNPGQWDGYPDERERLLQLLSARAGDVVVVSGDLHSSWAAELGPEAGGEPVATELVVPAVSAPSFARALVRNLPGGRPLLERVIRRANPHVRYVALGGHGYLLLDVTDTRIEAQWWQVDTVRRRSSDERLAARWSVVRGDPRLRPG